MDFQVIVSNIADVFFDVLDRVVDDEGEPPTTIRGSTVFPEGMVPWEAYWVGGRFEFCLLERCYFDAVVVEEGEDFFFGGPDAVCVKLHECLRGAGVGNC